MNRVLQLKGKRPKARLRILRKDWQPPSLCGGRPRGKVFYKGQPGMLGDQRVRNILFCLQCLFTGTSSQLNLFSTQEVTLLTVNRKDDLMDVKENER
jgi:hypothetical protein